MAPSPPLGPDRGPTPRNLITAGIAFVAALTVGGVTLAMCSAGGDDTDEAAPASRVTVTTTATATGGPSAAPNAPVPSAGASSASPAPAPSPRVLWRGQLKVNGPRAEKDLDQVPPRTDPGAADVRGDWLVPLLKGQSGAQLAKVESGKRPGPTECRDAALASGGPRTEELDTGDVVCLLTKQGRVARLITREAHMTSTSPVLTFDALIWEVPSGA